MKTKSNKKSLLGMANFLLLLVMLCGVAVGSVFAKYATQEEAHPQSATVAKWGIEITINDDNLFGQRYVYDDSEGAAVVDTANGTAVIYSTDSSFYLVAPGSKGSMSFSITGNSEVSSKLSFDVSSATDILLKGSLSDSNGSYSIMYSPIVWTITSSVDGSYSGSLSDCLSKLTEKTYAPNTEINVMYTLSWEWAFENDASLLTDGTDATAIISIDEADTLLSLMAYDSKNGTSRTETYLTDYTFIDVDSVLNTNLVFSIGIEQIN